MSTYVVNGHSVEFDPFDLDNLELYLSSVNRLDEARRVRSEGEGPVETLRRICDLILDFFDDLLGEGMAKEIFGEKINVKIIMDSYRAFCSEVNEQIGDYSKEIAAPTAPKATNREQRRAELRAISKVKP